MVAHLSSLKLDLEGRNLLFALELCQVPANFATTKKPRTTTCSETLNGFEIWDVIELRSDWGYKSQCIFRKINC